MFSHLVSKIKKEEQTNIRTKKKDKTFTVLKLFLLVIFIFIFLEAIDFHENEAELDTSIFIRALTVN